MALELQLSQGMAQTLSPQMRQAFELLQLPLIELSQLVRHEMETNPVIECGLEPNLVSIEGSEPKQLQQSNEGADGLDFDPQVDAVLRLDDGWRDYFLQGMENADAEDEKRYEHAYESISQSETLQEHLLGQLSLVELDDNSRNAAELIIGDIDERGYFSGSLPDIAMATGLDITELEKLLKVVQTFTPTGVGARDLRECLLLQVDAKTNPELHRVIADHLNDFAVCTSETLADRIGIDVDRLATIRAELRELNPTPGLAFSEAKGAEYVLPEMAIRPKGAGFEVILNNSELPSIRISERYRQMLDSSSVTAKDKSYIRERIRAAVALINNIDRRQHTIKSIALAIANAQSDFLHGGELKPLTMHEVANQVGVHETTISRTVNGKYAVTPRGVFELRRFFPRGISATNGADVVATDKVRDALKALVDSEDPRNPLSDQVLCESLKKQGYNVARRTIAKYRDQLHIPSSKDRKKV